MYHFVWRSTLTNSEDPDEMPHYEAFIMRHSIWVFNVCNSTHLGVSHMQKVNCIKLYHRLLSLCKAHDAKRWSPGWIFLSSPHNRDRILILTHLAYRVNAKTRDISNNNAQFWKH